MSISLYRIRRYDPSSYPDANLRAQLVFPRAHVNFRFWSAILGIFLLFVGAGCGSGEPRVTDGTDEEKKLAIETMYQEYRPDFPDAPEIGVEELLRLQSREEVILVDVREAYERAVSIIPGAISKELFEAEAEEFEGKTIVVHCTIGYRSGKYVEELMADGIHAFNLKGSILSWVHAGQPVVDSEGDETKRVHVYGERWNLLPAGYEAVW